MKKPLIQVISLTVVLVIAFFLPLSCIAHSGGTDSNGGHYNRSTGEYHYHHGHPAHQHPNGFCIYEYLWVIIVGIVAIIVIALVLYLKFRR